MYSTPLTPDLSPETERITPFLFAISLAGNYRSPGVLVMSTVAMVVMVVINLIVRWP